MNFDDRQKDYYLREINRTIPVNNTGSLSAKTAQNAFRTIDPLLARDAIGLGLSPDLVTSASSLNSAIASDAACRGYSFPAENMRTPGARAGCGWWYVQDPSRPSTAAYGTQRGPMSPTLSTQFGAGRWVWDPQEAQRLEGMKQGQKIRACPDIQYSQVPNMGWCPSTGMAILTDGQGNPAFPRSAGGDCPGAQIITNAASCPPTPPSSGGVGAGSAGAGASGGGSGGGASITTLCSPQPDGSLSPGCLQALSNQMCSPAGVLSQSLGGAGYAGQSDSFTAINNFLSQRQFTIPAPIISGGAMSTDQALSAFGKIRQQANTGDGSAITAATGALCYGTPFDPCSLSPTDPGPFSADCINRTAAKMGYAANAAILPGNSPTATAFWAKMRTWQDVIDQLTYWKQTADTQSGSKGLQVQAIQNVYGATVRYPVQGCNVNGIFLDRYLYAGPNGSLYNQPKQLSPTDPAHSNTHFLGRYLLKNGFNVSPTSNNSDATPSGSFPAEFQHMETVFTPTTAGTYQFAVAAGASDQIMIWIDGALYGTYGPQNNGGIAVLPVINGWLPGVSHTLTVDFLNTGAPWSFNIQMSVNGAPWAAIPAAQLTLPYDRRVPMLDVDFTAMTTYTPGMRLDKNGLFANLFLQPPATLTTINGVNCYQVGGGAGCVLNYLNYSQGIRARACKSYTMMVYVSDMATSVGNPVAPGGSLPSLFNFYNAGSSDPTQVRPGFPAYMWDYGFRQQDMGLYLSPQGMQFMLKGQVDPTHQSLTALPKPTPFLMNTWVHVAIVWDEDWGGYTLFVNGTPAMHERIQNVPPVTLVYEQVRIGRDYPFAERDSMAWWHGGIAWFRGFDYRLSQSLIQADMSNGWANVAYIN